MPRTHLLFALSFPCRAFPQIQFGVIAEECRKWHRVTLALTGGVLYVVAGWPLD